MARIKKARLTDLLPAEEAAKLAGRSETTIRNWNRWGWLPNTFKKGRVVLYHAGDIKKVLEDLATKGGA